MKKIELGKCPYCNAGDYSRADQDWFDDTCKCTCICHNCGESFVEYFQLDEVKFEKDGEEFIYNNSLNGEHKKILREALSVYSDYIENFGKEGDFKEIYTILNGGTIQDE